MRLNGKLIFPQPLAGKLEPWRIPTNTIHQPLVSFTAARGIAPWLEKQSWAQSFDISPVPNQIFIWAMGRIPLQTFAAVPVPDGKKALAQFEQKVSAQTNWQKHLVMPLTMEKTNNQLPGLACRSSRRTWRRCMSRLATFCSAVFLPIPSGAGRCRRNCSRSSAQTNLVYYHWEITAGRLKVLPQLTQLGLMLTRHKQLDAQSAAGKWLNRVGPTLGNNVTEVTQTAPNELSFTRKAPGGLHGH